MLIFLDTEFTDFIDCDLISIGMVCEDGSHQLYLERSDYRSDWCSDFVRAAVLPQLGQFSSAVTRAELAKQLIAWFATLPEAVTIACDSFTDWELLHDALGDHSPVNLKGRYDLRDAEATPIFQEAAVQYHEQGNPWHHALHDAQAHRHGWKALQAHPEVPRRTSNLNMAVGHMNASTGPILSTQQLAAALQAGSLNVLSGDPGAAASVSYLFVETDPYMIAQCAYEAGTDLDHANRLYEDLLTHSMPRVPAWEALVGRK